MINIVGFILLSDERQVMFCMIIRRINPLLWIMDTYLTRSNPELADLVSEAFKKAQIVLCEIVQGANLHEKYFAAC